MTEQMNGQPAGMELHEIELQRLICRVVETTIDTMREGRVNGLAYSDEGMFTLDQAEGVLRELYEYHRETFGECLRGAFADLRKMRPGPRVAR